MIQPIRIKSGTSTMTQFRTFCSYGDTRTGKTRFAGTFPNALFISDASERGWTTLEHMAETDFYHPGHGPVILPVSNQTAMNHALVIAEDWVRRGWISSVVIDSLTFYAESWYQHELQKMLAAPGSKGPDVRSLYGALGNHLSNTRQIVHSWPCHVVWLALASAPADGESGGPMLTGKSKHRFPAGCDHIFYHRRYEAVDPDTQQPVMVFEARTQPYDRYIGGGRDNGLLPDPLVWPTFRTVAELLSLPEFPATSVPDSAISNAVASLPNRPMPTSVIAPAAANSTPTAPVASSTAAAVTRRPAARSR